MFHVLFFSFSLSLSPISRLWKSNNNAKHHRITLLSKYANIRIKFDNFTKCKFSDLSYHVICCCCCFCFEEKTVTKIAYQWLHCIELYCIWHAYWLQLCVVDLILFCFFNRIILASGSVFERLRWWWKWCNIEKWCQRWSWWRRRLWQWRRRCG